MGESAAIPVRVASEQVQLEIVVTFALHLI
jgi:hypothetical protein